VTREPWTTTLRLPPDASFPSRSPSSSRTDHENRTSSGFSGPAVSATSVTAALRDGRKMLRRSRRSADPGAPSKVDPVISHSACSGFAGFSSAAP
jgi:hypothetical protein